MSEPLIKNSPAEKKVIIFSAVVGVLFLAVDFATKYWVVNCFELFESREVIPGVFAFTSVRNTGAAWSILSGQVWLLFGIALAALILLIVFFRKIYEGWPERSFAAALLISGIIGNAYDRAFRGAVVDFLHVHWYNVWHYTVFNVADIAICCGAGLFILSNIIRKEAKPDKEK